MLLKTCGGSADQEGEEALPFWAVLRALLALAEVALDSEMGLLSDMTPHQQQLLKLLL